MVVVKVLVQVVVLPVAFEARQSRVSIRQKNPMLDNSVISRTQVVHSATAAHHKNDNASDDDDTYSYFCSSCYSYSYGCACSDHHHH